MLVGASLFFVLFTGSINSAEQMGGPMSMSPSSTEWCFIVLFIDLLLVLIGFVGSRIFGLPHKVAGVLIVLIGVSLSILGIHNQMNSPQIDNVGSGLRMPVPPALNITVYVIAGVLVLGGLFLLARSPTKQNS